MAADTKLRARLARWLLAAGSGVELAENLKRARKVAAGEALASVTDGCIAKPPQEQEVLARVEAVLQVPASFALS